MTKKSKPIRLTQKQRALATQLEGLLHILDLDTDHIIHTRWENARARTDKLRSAIEYIVRSRIIYDHLWIDDTLSVVLQAHVHNKGKLTKLAERITESLTDRVYTSQKLDILTECIDVPKSVINTIRALNQLRNNAAHQIVIDDADGKIMFKGHDLMTLDGFAFFLKELTEVQEFFRPEIDWLLDL